MVNYGCCWVIAIIRNTFFGRWQRLRNSNHNKPTFPYTIWLWHQKYAMNHHNFPLFRACSCIPWGLKGMGCFHYFCMYPNYYNINVFSYHFQCFSAAFNIIMLFRLHKLKLKCYLIMEQTLIQHKSGKNLWPSVSLIVLQRQSCLMYWLISYCMSFNASTCHHVTILMYSYMCVFHNYKSHLKCCIPINDTRDLRGTHSTCAVECIAIFLKFYTCTCTYSCMCTSVVSNMYLCLFV